MKTAGGLTVTVLTVTYYLISAKMVLKACLDQCITQMVSLLQFCCIPLI